MPDFADPDDCGLDGLPDWVKLKVRRFAWSLALAETKSPDIAFARMRDICRDLGGFLRLPTHTRYFEHPTSDITWIQYVSRLLEALEALTPRRGPNQEGWPEFSEATSIAWDVNERVEDESALTKSLPD
jgi:hypothetical protein